jgi:hypothetical protein
MPNQDAHKRNHRFGHARPGSTTFLRNKHVDSGTLILITFGG